MPSSFMGRFPLERTFLSGRRYALDIMGRGKENDIEVRGRLLVRGIPEKPVLFDTAGGCAAGPWGGIRFRPGSGGVIEHARVRCAGSGIDGALSGVRRIGIVIESGR